MDIHELEAFARAYESGSLTTAAEEAFVSRQAFSKTVAHLEGELGALFVRLPRGIAPTPLAETLYPHVKRALAEVDAIAEESRRFARGEAGSLRLAIEANAALTLPMDLVDAYAEARPGVSVTRLVLPPAGVREAFNTGRVDVVVAGPPPRGSGLRFEPVFAGPLVIVFPRKAFRPEELALAGASMADGVPTLGLDALAGRKVFGIDPDNPVERGLEPFLAKRVPTAEVVYGNSDTALTTSQMRSGLGGIIVEAGGARRDFSTSEYVHIPLVGPGSPVWEVGLSFAPDSPAVSVASDFATFARGRMRQELDASE